MKHAIRTDLPRSLLLVLLALAVLAGPLFAQTPGDPLFEPPPLEPEPDTAREGRLPVQIVGGRLVAHAELSTIHRRIPANLFVEFDNPTGLRLHNRVAQALEAEDEAGQTTPISIHFPEFTITVERRESGPEETYEEFTRLYSREIREDALVGSIGARILGQYRVTFDLQNGWMELARPDADPDEPAVETADDPALPPDPDADPGETPEELKVDITTTDDIVWLPIQIADGSVHAMALATTRYDSLVDAQWCDRLGHPAGNVGPLRLGSLDLAEFAAFRPEEVIYVHPDGAIGVIGLNVLKHLRLTIDREQKSATCQVTAPPDFPEADLAFFKAMVAEDPDQLESWLQQHRDSRLGEEAAQLLLGYRIDEDAEPESFQQAIRWLRDTWREDMISTLALDLMRELRAAGYPLQAVYAGELGIEGGRKDRYPNSVHRLHATMGEILLDHDQGKRAWRHLLSAAFGLPEDGLINLKLGEFYEKQGRYSRAMSRYVQAVVTLEAGAQALEGLERVQQHLGRDERLSVDTIAPLIAGKTYNYAAATRYRPAPGEEENTRTALVEFFTNTHIKHPNKEEGAIGGALGNEGVMTYFPRSKVAMLAYHLPHAQAPLDSLVNELAQATADRYRAPPTVQVVNGRSSFPGYGHVSDAEAIYKAGREIILQSLKQPSPFNLQLDASVENGRIDGTLVVDGPEESGALVQIVLAERGVLYPGKSKVVIQRMVARASLTGDLEGVPYQPEQGRMTIPFSRSLAEITEANREYLLDLQASGAGSVQTFAARMDPRQLTVVAFVRKARANEVLQAIQIDPTLEDDDGPEATTDKS